MNKQELLTKIDKLETSGMKVTKSWYDIWSEAMRYMFSDQDTGVRKHDDWEYVIVNYIWPTAIQEIAKLAKNNPRIIATPYSADDAAVAEVWQGACQWQWQSALKMRLNQIAAIFCGKIFGYRVSKLYLEEKSTWNKDKRQWTGDIKYKLWHPTLFWADGDETIDDGNCGTVRWVSLEYAQNRWPKFKDKFEEIAVSAKDGDMSGSGDTKLRSWMSSGTLKQSDGDDVENLKPSALLSLLEGINRIDPESDEKIVRISECYFKDYEERHQEQEEEIPAAELVQSGQVYTGVDQKLYDISTNQPYAPEKWPTRLVREWDEPVYPTGRYVISAGDGDSEESRLILNPKEEEQVWQFSRWPFVVTPHYLLPFMWQGINAVSLYKGAQDMINISISHMVNNLKQFGDPRMAIEDNAIAINPKTKKPWSIKAGAGALIRLVKGGLGKYKIEYPLPLSPAALGLYELFSQEYKNLTGMQGIGQGIQLKQGTTATEATTLAINANDRIFLQSVYEDEWIKGLVSLMAEMMQLYYDEGRLIRIIGEDQIEGVQQITSKMKDVKYDITVAAGTTLPFDEEKKILKYKEAYSLFQSPTANPMMPELLRALEIPNWKKLLDEFPTYQKYLAFVQLYQNVKAGKVAPEQAVEMLVQAAMQEYNSEVGQSPIQGNTQ